jgi:hypothetical protein
MVNCIFREGISDEKYNEFLKEIKRPENCTSLTKDVMVQSQQNTVIKASCNIVKLLNKLETMKETVEIGEIQSCIDLGTTALGLL